MGDIRGRHLYAHKNTWQTLGIGILSLSAGGNKTVPTTSLRRKDTAGRLEEKGDSDSGEKT